MKFAFYTICLVLLGLTPYINGFANNTNVGQAPTQDGHGSPLKVKLCAMGKTDYCSPSAETPVSQSSVDATPAANTLPINHSLQIDLENSNENEKDETSLVGERGRRAKRRRFYRNRRFRRIRRRKVRHNKKRHARRVRRIRRARRNRRRRIRRRNRKILRRRRLRRRRNRKIRRNRRKRRRGIRRIVRKGGKRISG